MRTWRQRCAHMVGRVIRRPRLTKPREATTPSASSTPGEPLDHYISRAEAAARYEGTPEDIFQGDIFRDVDVMIPRAAGDYRDYEPFPVIVVAHDCEWTKVQQLGPDYKLGIAPLRRLSSFRDEAKPGIEGTIANDRVRYLFPLPREDPLDDSYVVDLRMIQPITAAVLLDEDLWTSVGDGIKVPLQGKLHVFFTDLELVRDDPA